MDASSGSCKLRDEQYYKHLDDEKKYFLVLMLGDFQNAMIIPEEVVRRFKGEISGEIKLETRNGYSHIIMVARNQEKLVLTVGWRKFIENYDLHMGDSLIFRYKGKSQFNVMIFDKLGREKALSVVLDPFIPQVQDRPNEEHEIGSSKKMDVPWERCKRRIEYHYTNLDDEKKYFLVPMMGDFQHEMIIPEEFVKRFKGEFPREVILETQNRRSYTIGVAKNDNGKLVLTVGWVKFVETFGPEMGDTILFRYNGNSQFHVIIFDELGCEKASSVFVGPFPPPVQERCTSATDTVKSSHFHSETIQMQPLNIVKEMPMESPRLQKEMGKSCQDNNTVISISSRESSGDSFSSGEEYGVREVPGSNYIVRKKKARPSSFQKGQLKYGYITASKTKLTSAQTEVVKQKVQSIHTEIPIFVSVMRKHNMVVDFCLTFPRLYAKNHLGEEPHMYLQLLGKKWEVRLGETKGCKNLRSGWRKFVEDNKLKIDDICLFKLLRNRGRTMEVYVIPANDAKYQAGIKNDADREAAFRREAPAHHADEVRDPDSRLLPVTKTEAMEDYVVSPDGARSTKKVFGV